MKTKPRTRETGGSNRSYMLTTLRFVAGASSNPHVVTINIAHVSAMVPHGRLFEGGRRHKRTRRFENHSECACTLTHPYKLMMMHSFFRWVRSRLECRVG